MIRGLEFAGFVVLAAAVHAGIWIAAPEGGGTGGEGGTRTVTITASTPQMAALAAAWQRPVPVQATAPAPRRAPVPDTTSVALRPEIGHAAPPAPAALPDTALPDTARAPDRRPQIDTAPLRARAPRLAALAPAAAAVPDLPHETALMARKAPPAATARPSPPAAPLAPTMRPPPQIDRAPPVTQAPLPTVPQPTAKRPRARPAPASQSQVARGVGGAQAGGRAQTAAPARINDATRASLMGQWGGAIRARIERHKRYPSGTRASGTAHLVLSVATDGRLLGVSVRRSSGDARLDAAAMTAVRRARLPAAPKRLPGARHRFNLPVTFTR